MIYPDCDMKKWEHCDNSVILANANYYYTKKEVDEIVDDIDGMDEEDVQRMIDRSIRTKADKTDVIALSGQVQDNADAILNTYTKAETNALFTPYSTTAQMNAAIDSATSGKADTSAVSQVNNALTAHTADTSVHTTSAEKAYWNNKLDASAYTPTDLSNYYTKGQTDDLLDEKLDASAYTPTDLSNYYTKQETNGVVDEAVSGKADTTYVNQIATNKFGYTSYDSQTQRINFYSHSNSQDVLAYIDATAFIKDGMVSNVEIVNGNLVITFNSDAGKQPISIPLTDIFNPANYYTTAQTQSYVSGFTYDKETIDQKVASGGTFDPDLYYDKTATDALLAAKADTASTYTKTEVDTALGNKADASALTAVASDVQTVSGQVATKVATSDFNTYTAATETALNGKVNTSALDDYYTKTEVYNKTEVDAAYTTAYQALTAHTADTTVHVTSAEKATWNNKSDFSGDYNDLTNKPTIPTVPTNISDFTNDAGYITNADIADKADTTALTQVNDALTAHTANTSVHVTSAEKAEWNDKAEVIELTQAQYDALVTKDPDVLYVISDATAADISNYWTSAQTQSAITQAVSGKVDTSAITSAITSGSTDSEIPTAKAVYDAIPTGGGATYSAGTNISIDSANTINCTIPFDYNTGYDRYNLGTGIINASSSLHSIAIGSNVTLKGNDGVAIGRNNTITGASANVVVIGVENQGKKGGSVVIGNNSTSDIAQGVAIGTNVYVTGTTKTNINNQIWADTNNQVYIKDKTNTTDVCIQDAIAALGGLKLVSLSQSEYDNLATKDANTLYIINNVVS